MMTNLLKDSSDGHAPEEQHHTRSQLEHFPWFTFYILSLTSVNSEDSEAFSWTDSSHLGEGEK